MSTDQISLAGLEGRPAVTIENGESRARRQTASISIKRVAQAGTQQHVWDVFCRMVLRLNGLMSEPIGEGTARS